MTVLRNALGNMFFFLEVLCSSFLQLCFPFLPTFDTLLQWVVSSSILILALLLLRGCLKGRVSCRVRYALWSVVLVRLLLPFQFSFSLPYSAVDVTPETPVGWEQASVPVFPSLPYDIEDASIYHQDLEPGYLGPSAWAQFYVHRSEDGQTMTTYVDMYTPSEIVQSIWWVGTLIFALIFFLANLRFYRKLCRIRRPLSISQCPCPVYVAEGLPSPCLFGLFRPSIYLTQETAADETALRHVLAHELTHRAHWDHIWALLRCVCLVLHWFNPLVWLAVFLSKGDSELACDEGAVKRLGEAERLSYGRTLVDMVARRSGRPADLLSCSTSMTGGKAAIQQRVKLLVKHPQTVKTALFAAVAVAALAAVFTFSGPSAFQGDYDSFLEELSSQDHIQVNPLPVQQSSASLELTLTQEARTLLASGQKASGIELAGKYRSDTQWDGSAQIFIDCGESGQAHAYFLLEEQDGCHLAAASRWEDGVHAWTPLQKIALLPSGAVEQLHALVHQRPADGALSAGELAWFNEGNFFDNGGETAREHNIRNQFLTSYYQRPQDIDLYQLFYNGSYLPQAQEVTEQEMTAITGVENWPGVWADKTTTAEMDQVLRSNMGLTLDQTNQVGLDRCVYLPQYGAYYIQHGDTNYIWNIQFTSGFREGDMVTLFYEHEYLGPCALVLRGTGSSYLFYAHRPCAPEWTAMTTLEFMRQLQTKYVSQAATGSFPPDQVSTDLEALVWLIQQAAKAPITREYDFASHGRWSLTIYALGPSGERYVGIDNALTLSVGEEENVVCFCYQYLSGQEGCYVFADSPQLYQVIRSLATEENNPPVQEEYIVSSPDDVRELSALFLENEEARVLNLADSEGSVYDDWLQDPNLTYTIRYGVPFGRGQICWYATARSGGGSAYQILIPDSMADAVLEQCRPHGEALAGGG